MHKNLSKASTEILMTKLFLTKSGVVSSNPTQSPLDPPLNVNETFLHVIMIIKSNNNDNNNNNFISRG